MAIGGQIQVTARSPGSPEGAGFALKIDFKKGDGDPQRVFQVADQMIGALRRVDRALCSSINVNINPAMILEDTESGSLIIRLKNFLETTDDQIIRDLDWRKSVGSFLLWGKYSFIDWANKSEEGSSLVELAQDLSAAAHETDVLNIPDYEPPSVTELAEAVKEIDGAKSHLIEGDQISYIVESSDEKEEKSIDFDLSVKWSVEELDELVVKKTVSYENTGVNLIVKKPDYLGNSKWDMRSEKHPLSVRIADHEWLEQFQSRMVDVRPGDALKCAVTVKEYYDHNNKLIKKDVTVASVEEVLIEKVLRNEITQGHLFDSED